MKDKWSVLIVGAGQIGAMADSPTSKRIVSHAHGFRVVKGFEKLGFVDVDVEKAKAAAKRWGGEVYADLKKAQGARWDVVVISTSNETHYELVLQALCHEPEVMVIEKPVTTKLELARKLQRAVARTDVRVYVNYIRRLFPEYQRVKVDVEHDKYGPLVAGAGYYSKGLLHNGSHLVDLAKYWLGKPTIQKVFKDRELNGTDRVVSALLSYGRGTIGLFSVNEADYLGFELDLWFQKKRLRLWEYGLLMEEFVGKKRRLSSVKDVFLTAHSVIKVKANAQGKLVAEHVSRILAGAETSLCSLEEAVDTLKICSEMAKSR